MYLYQESGSFFHSLHPVAKFLFLILLIALPFASGDFRIQAAQFSLYFILLLVAGGKANLKRFWKLLVLFWIFAFLIWIAVPFLRHVPWSVEGTAALATRIDTFVLAGLIFVTITRIEEFTFALTRLGIPYKGAFALSLGFRLVPLFYQNLQIIVDAQRSRGVDLHSGNLVQKAKKYVPIIGVLLSYGIRNADTMAMALEAKGFGYSPQRTSFLQPRFGWRDVLVLLLSLITLVVLNLMQL